jgi:hypothetical protein
MTSVENIRTSSGEGLPICIDSARIFSSDPNKSNQLVYVAYEGKRYYASNPTELAENIEGLIRGNPLPSAAERLPQEESAARALVGSQVDITPKRSSPLASAFGRMGADLKRGATSVQKAFLPRGAPATAPVPATKKNSVLWGALKRAGTDAGTAGKAIGSATSATGSFIGKRFTRKNGATPVANAPTNATAAPDATPEQPKSAGRSWSNWAKTFRASPKPETNENKARRAELQKGIAETLSVAKAEAARPGSVAAGTPAAAPSAIPERKTAANLARNMAAADAAAPAGGSRRRKERRRKVRPLTAPTRRARHQVKAHK